MAVRTGSGKYLQRTANLPGITAFSVLGWVKISVDTNNYSAFFSFGNTGPFTGSFYTLATEADGTTQMSYNGSVSSTSGGLAPITVGTWYYASMVVEGTGTNQFKCTLIDPSTHTAYTITIDGNSGVSGQEMLLGDDNYSGEYIDGCIENVLVYGAALTTAEVYQQMWSRLPIRTANLNGWYPLLADSKDYSGNGYNWTDVGSITWEAGPGVSWGDDDSFVLTTVAGGGGGGATRGAPFGHGSTAFNGGRTFQGVLR